MDMSGEGSSSARHSSDKHSHRQSSILSYWRTSVNFANDTPPTTTTTTTESHATNTSTAQPEPSSPSLSSLRDSDIQSVESVMAASHLSMSCTKLMDRKPLATVSPSSSQTATDEISMSTTVPQRPALFKDASSKYSQQPSKGDDGAHDAFPRSELDAIDLQVQSKNKTENDMDNPSGLSEYELLRLRNIQRNNARLAALGLLNPKSVRTNATPKRPPARKRPSKAVEDVTQQPVRRSTRQRMSKADGNSHLKTPSTKNQVEASTTQFPPAEPTVETYDVSPLSQYAMSMEIFEDVPQHQDAAGTFTALVPLKTRLAPPRGLSSIYSLQFHDRPDSPWIVGAGKAGIISLWNATQAFRPTTTVSSDNSDSTNTIDPILAWKAHSGRWIAEARLIPTNCALPSAPPQRLLSAGNDGTVCLWDLTTVSSQTASPKLLASSGKSIHSSGIFAMDVIHPPSSTLYSNSPFVQLVTGSKDKSIAISTIFGPSIEPRSWYSHHHSAKVSDVRFRGLDSTLLASAGDDGVIAIHDFRSHRIVAESTAAHARPHSVLWDPKQEHVFLTAGHDKTVKFWDLRRFSTSSPPLAVLQGHVPSHVTKCNRIHRPIFYHPFSNNNAKMHRKSFVLTGGQDSHSLSMYQQLIEYGSNDNAIHATTNNNALQVPLFSRGKLPDDCGDVGAMAVNGSTVALSTEQGEILLLRPNTTTTRETNNKSTVIL